MIIAGEIKKIALDLGFDEVGITKPSALAEGEKAISDWVAEGRHAEMKYMEDFAERRDRFYADFSDAKSVIVLGVNYYTNSLSSVLPCKTGEDEGGGIRGRVARYAWGKDYHAVIAQKHKILIEKLRQMAGRDFRAKSCVDTQPIPERFAATRAGLGFIGKHTGLLSQKFGPWLFLSEIVTNLDLDEDIPAKGNCGTCVDCQKVCPTGALDQDYKIDARLCIAYLTIEHKGIIPRELRPKIKDWVFGCDECFAVCPFTSKSKESKWPELGPESGVGEWLGMDELFNLKSNRDHEKKFSGTALLRTNRKQILRNACVVLGNSKKLSAIPYLEKALSESAPLVRLHAAWALGQIPVTEAAQEMLRNREMHETHPEVLEEIRHARNTLKGVIPAEAGIQNTNKTRFPLASPKKDSSPPGDGNDKRTQN